MPLTEEQKLRKKITAKKHYENNKAKILEQQKKWRDDNKEKVLLMKKIHYDNNKQHYKNNAKKWKLNNPDKAHQSNTISAWKKYTIICDDYDLIYRIYVDTNKCEFCLEPFKNSLDRHLDHNHNILDSYNIRGILCFRCNIKDVLKDYPIKDYPLD